MSTEPAPRAKRDAERRLSGLGFEFAAGVGGFALFGYWIGRYYDNGRLGLVIGAVLGIVGGMYNLIRVSLASSKGGPAGEGRNSDKGES